MPIFEYACNGCGAVFEVIVDRSDGRVPCEICGSADTKKLIGVPAFHVKTDSATPRIEKRVKDYLLDGKFSEATRFANKAASMVKSDKVKKIADTLQKKTGK
jgi:putative FmdB family regulatory protein